MRIIGYDTFLNLLKAAYLLRLAGVPSAHVLVVSPPGTAKTTMAKLFAKAVGAVFVRTTGRYDMLPEDFIAENETVYEGISQDIVQPGSIGEQVARRGRPMQEGRRATAGSQAYVQQILLTTDPLLAPKG